MLDNNKIQYIGKIENSNNVVIINGNLTIDGQISKDLQTSCLEILRTDFDKYTTTAIEQAKQEIEECIKSILEKLAKEQQKHLTERFQSLSMQAFLHDTLIEYISTEDKRAKEFIITKSDLVEDSEIEIIKERLSIYEKPISVATHGPKSLYNKKGKILKLDKIKGKKVLLFSALANPNQFLETVKKFSPKEIQTIDFKDHHSYDKKDYEMIKSKAKEMKADLIISTEKDYVKFKEELELEKLYVLSIEFNVLEDNICWNF